MNFKNFEQKDDGVHIIPSDDAVKLNNLRRLE